MNAKSLNQATLTNLVAGLQRQAQDFTQLARAVAELEEKVNAIRRKLGIRSSHRVAAEMRAGVC